MSLLNSGLAKLAAKYAADGQAAIDATMKEDTLNLKLACEANYAWAQQKAEVLELEIEKWCGKPVARAFHSILAHGTEEQLPACNAILAVMRVKAAISTAQSLSS